MQYLQLTIKSIKCFIRQEKTLALWTLSGIILASLMLLICSGWYFERYTDAEYEQFVQNRFDFIFDSSFDKAFILGDKLIADDKIQNVCISASYEDGLRLESWYLPEKAYIYVRSGTLPNDFSSENWCIITDEYQWDISAEDANVPHITDSIFLAKGISFTCVGISGSSDYDILISKAALQRVLQEEKEDSALLQIQVTYVYKNETLRSQLEDLNGEIIDKYQPNMVVRGEKVESYSFLVFIKEMSSIILLLLFTVVNYTIMYNYWIKKRLYTYQIYRMCGLTLHKMIIMIFLEQFFSIIMVHLTVSAVYILALNIGTFERTPSFSVLILQNLFTGGVLLIINIIIFTLIGRKMAVESILSEQ